MLAILMAGLMMVLSGCTALLPGVVPGDEPGTRWSCTTTRDSAVPMGGKLLIPE